MSWERSARSDSQPKSGTTIIRINPTVSEKLEGGGVQAGASTNLCGEQPKCETGGILGDLLCVH